MTTAGSGLTQSATTPMRARLMRTSTVVVLGACGVAVASAVALPWADSFGSGHDQACLQRDPPYAPPYEAWLVKAEQSVWPLGVRCVWTDPQAARTVQQPPGWGSTAVALGGLGVAATWLVGRSRPGGSGRTTGRAASVPRRTE